MKKVVLSLLIVSAVSSLVASDCPGDKMANGWCYPTGSSDFGGYYGYSAANSQYEDSGLHLAQDMKVSKDDPIYAIADGIVIDIRDDVDGYGGLKKDGAGLIIRHVAMKNGNIVEFDALYAHVKNVSVSVNQVVSKGQSIALTGFYDKGGPDHLHFGIIYPAGEASNPWAGYGDSSSGFVDPMAFLKSNTSVTVYSKYGNIAWNPPSILCYEAVKWINPVTKEVIADKRQQSVDAFALCQSYGAPLQCSQDDLQQTPVQE